MSLLITVVCVCLGECRVVVSRQCAGNSSVKVYVGIESG